MKIKKILILLCISILLLLSLFQPLRAYEEFYFDEYSIELDVKENGEIHVKETFDTNFTGALHGIYIDIPAAYEMMWEDGSVKDYYFPITNVKVNSNHDYLIENYTDGVQIRLGSEYYYASTNEVYSIEYVLHTKDLDLDGRQMLFYNLISKNWDTYFNKINFRIHLPKEIDANTIVFDTPEGIIKESNDIFSYSYRGNTITGSYNKQLAGNNAITLWIELPNGYFNFPNMDIYNYIALGISIVFTALIALIFIKKGKDEPLIPVIEFTAPDGLNSAEVGYVIDGVCDNSDVVSLILYWAQKGYLTIEDNEQTNELIFHKLTNIPDTENVYEKHMFTKLFATSDSVTTDSLKGTFYQTIQATIEKVGQKFSTKDKRIYQSKALQVFTWLVAGFPLAIATAIQLYAQTYAIDFAMIVFGIYATVIAMLTAILIYCFNRWYSSSTGSKIASITIVSIITILIVLISYVIFKSMIPVPLLIVQALLCVAIMLMSANMRQRSKYGNELLGRVVGLRDFILTAEKDRLDMLVKENPTIFYDILPYAYAFGITDVWSEHFKDIELEPCTWYTYYGTDYNFYRLTRRMNTSMNQFQNAATYIPQTEKSSGGFSGGSGGGFSGGGFGGSGGGGW